MYILEKVSEIFYPSACGVGVISIQSTQTRKVVHGILGWNVSYTSLWWTRSSTKKPFKVQNHVTPWSYKIQIKRRDQKLLLTHTRETQQEETGHLRGASIIASTAYSKACLAGPQTHRTVCVCVCVWDSSAQKWSIIYNTEIDKLSL